MESSRKGLWGFEQLPTNVLHGLVVTLMPKISGLSPHKISASPAAGLGPSYIPRLRKCFSDGLNKGYDIFLPSSPPPFMLLNQTLSVINDDRDYCEHKVQELSCLFV